MYKAIDTFIGNYLVLENEDKAADYINPIEVQLVNETLVPGTKTDLTKFFKHPIEYAGILKEDPRVLMFYLGEDADLFQNKRFYDCYFKITDSRLFKKYNDRTGRDYNFIKGKWK